MKFITSLSVFVVISTSMVFSQNPITHQFAEKDNISLYMDVYQPVNPRPDKQCIIYVFGGGFKAGARNHDANFCRKLSECGYTAIAIDYRLGLKDVAKVDVFHTKALVNAIDMAVEDLFSAVTFILNNADMLNVNTEDMVLIGSSAGAMTILQADYELNNRFYLSKDIPEDFHFGGVIPFSGGIFSNEGKIKYRVSPPAPTFFLHGTEDKLVTYKQLKFLRKGMFGANALVKRFEKADYPYLITRYEGLGHEVAGFMMKNIDEINRFIDIYVDKHCFLQVDRNYYDPNLVKNKSETIRPKDLYRKK